MGAGIAEMIGGFMGAAGGTLGAPVSGGTSAVSVPGSIALAGAGAVTAGAALNNMFDVNISQSNTNGGGKGGSETKPKTFPDNPGDFNPEGLTKKTYDTKNGKIAKWFDSDGNAVYEWDEDLVNGSHYHAIGEDGNTRLPNSSGETHFKPGDNIPSN